jgi:hypothetical protein
MANVQPNGATSASPTAPIADENTPNEGLRTTIGKRGKGQFKRGRSGSGGGGGSGAGASSGWIRVGKNGKPLHHPGSSFTNSFGSTGGGDRGRDPISAVAASAVKFRRHGAHRVMKQPVHPSERRHNNAREAGERSRSSSGKAPGRNSGSSNDDGEQLSSAARKRLRRRQRLLRQQGDNPDAPADASVSAQRRVGRSAQRDDDDDDELGATLDSSEDFPLGPEGDELLSPPSDACEQSPDLAAATTSSTAMPSPATMPRTSQARGPVASHQASVVLRPLVRCTDGRTTSVRTLRDIVASTARGYVLDADTPIVRPAGHNADAMPSLSLGDAMDRQNTEDGGMDEHHPSTAELEEGYHHMHAHAAAAGGGCDHASPPIQLRFPPSAFTAEGIATPNTYYALPTHPPPPPISERHTYQDILLGFDAESETFAWHDDPGACERFATQLEILCREVQALLRVRSLLRRLDAPAYVLGDIHGNFADLSFFLKSFLVMNDMQLTPCQVLCLGDYVDRGPYSLECIALLFALCVEAPDRVVLLRGNHEDRVVCGDHRTYGDDCFWAQCCRRFGAERGTRVFRSVTRVFKDLPLACELVFPGNLNAKILCTHGGFPRFSIRDPSSFDRLNLLRREDFPRFLTLFPNNPLAQDDSGSDEDLPDYVEAAWFAAFDIVWSDPTTAEDDAAQSRLDENGFCCNVRGMNVMSFSQKAVEEYLRVTGYAMLFRAHQEKQFGLRLSKSSKVLTLFSSSNYQGHGNGAGCAVIDTTGNIQLVMKN